MENKNFITKVSQADLDNAREIEDYLLGCPVLCSTF